MLEEMNWNRFENFLGEEMPRCVKIALNISGYDTITSICEINVNSVGEIEKHINKNSRYELMQKIQCNHSEYYKKIKEFQFLPGHKTVILALPKYASQFQQLKSNISDFGNGDHFPFILNEMNRTAEMNQFKDANHATYSDTIRFFATYVFLLCGCSCYDMLRVNLPLPSTKTICE